MNSQYNIKDEIAVVILSCDKFKATWKPCVNHFFTAWPNCPYKVYLLNNFISLDDSRIKNLLVGEDKNWSDSLKEGLFKINENRLLFIFDDSFITYLNVKEIDDYFEFAVTHDLDSVSMKRNPFDREENYLNKLVKLKNSTKYRNSLFLNLIKKDVLLKLLISGENAWEFEKVGNKRSANFNFFTVDKGNLVKYKHGIIKGKWVPKTKTYLIKKGYILNDHEIKSHNFLKALGMECYAFIFLLGNKITNKFTKIFTTF